MSEIKPLTIAEFMTLDRRDVSQYLESVTDAFHELLRIDSTEVVGSVSFNRRIEALRSEVAEDVRKIRCLIGPISEELEHDSMVGVGSS